VSRAGISTAQESSSGIRTNRSQLGRKLFELQLPVSNNAKWADNDYGSNAVRLLCGTASNIPRTEGRLYTLVHKRLHHAYRLQRFPFRRAVSVHNTNTLSIRDRTETHFITQNATNTVFMKCQHPIKAVDLRTTTV
jgi:hypothetical protein